MDKKKLILLILLNFMTSLCAQQKWTLESKFLSEPDTILIFKPKTYTENKLYPLVYLLHGYSENYKQWSQTTDLQKLSDQYDLLLLHLMDLLPIT